MSRQGAGFRHFHSLAPLRLWRAQPNQGQELILPEESGDTLLLQLINGSVQLEGIDGDARCP